MVAGVPKQPEGPSRAKEEVRFIFGMSKAERDRLARLAKAAGVSQRQWLADQINAAAERENLL